METRASHISKESFPRLISKLWDVAMKPSHVIGGFKGSGIFFLSKDKVLSHLEPSTLFIDGEDKPTLNPVICSKYGEKGSASPFVRVHLKAHFTSLLQIKQCPKDRSKSRVRIEGEAITSDEFIQILKEQSSKKKTDQQKSKKDERDLDNIKVETENEVDESDLEGKNNVLS